MADAVRVSVTVNGQCSTAEVEPRLLLVHFLRDNLGLTGTHVGCDTSNCGACTVHLDGEAVKSCTVLAVQADGAEVTTIEGMADGRRPAPAAGGLLGRARPAVRLLHAGHDHGRRRPARSATRTRARTSPPGLDGNLCRCTGYHNIVKAVLDGAPEPRGRGGAGMSRSPRPHATEQRLRRPGAAPQGGPAADHRRGPLRRRHHAAGDAVVAFVRSPEAHAKIVSIDTSAARGARGVAAVYTGEDMADLGTAADGLGPARRRGQHARRTGRWPAARSTTSATPSPSSIGEGPLRASSTPPRTSSSSTSRCPSSSTPRRRSRTARRSSTRTLGTNKSTSGRWPAATSTPRFAESDVDHRAPRRQPPHRRRADRAPRRRRRATAAAT